MSRPYRNLLEASFPGIEKAIARWEALGFFWESSKLFIKEENGTVLSHAALPEPYLYDNGHLRVHGSWTLSHPSIIAPLSRC